MTPYYDKLPAATKKRLEPYLPLMAQSASENGLPLDVILSIAVKESGGNPKAINRGTGRQPARGMYQVVDEGPWLGGVDPFDTEKATPALAKTLKKVYDKCGGDTACVHYKYMAGMGAKYTPEAVAAKSKKFSYVGPRINEMMGLGGSTPATPLASKQSTLTASTYKPPTATSLTEYAPVMASYAPAYTPSYTPEQAVAAAFDNVGSSLGGTMGTGIFDQFLGLG